MQPQTLTCFLANEDATRSLGQGLAHIACKGDVFALYGTLGMGKSVLARAFVQELLGNVEVPSPTFTLVQSYETPEFEICHYDLYRLKNPDEIFELGMEEAMYESVCLIEWPERMQPYLPRKTIKIELSPQDNGRRVAITVASAEKHSLLSSLPEFSHD